MTQERKFANGSLGSIKEKNILNFSSILFHIDAVYPADYFCINHTL